METRKTFFEKEAFQITILLFMPLFSFSNFLIGFIFPKATHYSDYTISHFSNLLYLKDAFESGYGFPLWNSQILSGFPALANPLSGIWYPGNWLTVLFPLPLGSHLVTVFHLILGGIGMYLYLRKKNLSSFAAFFGAMAFQMMPKMFAHYAAGHISLVQAITFTPWLLYFQTLKRSDKKGRWFYFASSMVYALVILCDIRWTAYLLIMDVIFFTSEYFQTNTKLNKKFVKHLLLRLIPFGTSLLFTLFYLLPFLQYVNLTDRSMMEVADILNYSLPLGNLMGLIIPDMGGYAEYVVYPGIFVWVTFLGIFTLKPLRKKSLIMIIFIGLLMLFGFSGSLAFMKWIAYIPGINLLRVPSRMYFLISFMMIVLSAGYIHEIQFTEEPKKTINLLPQFFTLLFAAAMMGLVIYSGDILISDFYWPVAMSSIIFLLFILRKNTNRLRGLFQFVVVILCVIDYTVINSSQYDVYTEEMVMQQQNEIIDAIKPVDDELYRVYSPSYSVEQHLAALNGISQVNGIDPLHLKSYVQFMEEASGIPQNGYQVTIPAFATGNTGIDNINAVPDSGMLGLLNVRYLVSAYPIKEAGLTKVDQINGVYIYENRNYLPRAWVERDGKKYVSNVNVNDFEPNKIAIEANGPGDLVLSEIYYPGWKASVNGIGVPITTAHDILRAVALDDGENQIEMVFKPVLLTIGAILSLLSLLVSVVFLVVYKGQDQ
jgi:hypothetical protein